MISLRMVQESVNFHSHSSLRLSVETVALVSQNLVRVLVMTVFNVGVATVFTTVVVKVTITIVSSNTKCFLTGCLLLNLLYEGYSFLSPFPLRFILLTSNVLKQFCRSTVLLYVERKDHYSQTDVDICFSLCFDL